MSNESSLRPIMHTDRLERVEEGFPQYFVDAPVESFHRAVGTSTMEPPEEDSALSFYMSIRLILQTSPGDRFFLGPRSPQEFFFPEIPESCLIFLGTEDVVTGLDRLPRRGMPVHALKIVNS